MHLPTRHRANAEVFRGGHCFQIQQRAVGCCRPWSFGMPPSATPIRGMHSDKPAKYGVGITVKEIPLLIMRTGYPERGNLPPTQVDGPIGDLL